MSALPPAVANGLWYLLGMPESLAFRRALGHVAEAQGSVLRRLLRRNRDSDFGRSHGFASIRSVRDYQARVPLSSYDDYRDAIRRIGEGQAGVLTRDPVLLLEPTGGSTGGSKLVPYTATLRDEFGRAVAPWIEDLFRHDPRLLAGQAYWSISPVAHRQRRTPGGIPIGFEEDSEYFGPLRRALVRAALAVPSDARLIDDVDAFRYVTLLFLLRSRSLALISIWSPTFLSLLVEPLAAWWPRLADDVAAGTIAPPVPVATELLTRLHARIRPDRRRAEEIRAEFGAGGDRGAIHSRVWPRLRLISCWADAHAARDVPELGRLFPRARIQGKGLLATEGVVSIPLVGQAGAAPAIRSHFFEFLPSDGGPPRLAHELAPGREYAVAITTGGGLYRYQLDDLVRVVGWVWSCPLIRFAGKAAHVSDRFGEKLHERHVRTTLEALLGRYEVRASFAMLACEESAGRAAYTLFVEAPAGPDERLAMVGSELEAALRRNEPYRYCRDLGQLDAVRVFRVEGGAREVYLATCRAHGQRAGDVKPVALHNLGGWSRAFDGRLLGPSPAGPTDAEPSERHHRAGLRDGRRRMSDG